MNDRPPKVTRTDGHEVALAWEREHRERCKELNDVLDSLPNTEARREYYAALSAEERHGLIPEYVRRRTNEDAPVGALVRPTHERFSFTVRRDGGGVMRASHDGLAFIVAIPQHGSPRRAALLHPAWRDREGCVVRFAEISCHEVIEV